MVNLMENESTNDQYSNRKEGDGEKVPSPTMKKIGGSNATILVKEQIGHPITCETEQLESMKVVFTIFFDSPFRSVINGST
jgi:hypothetical protein